MTSHPGIRNSPYLIAFMLTSMMVWSFASITKNMGGALQQTPLQIRVPMADLGTVIQDSAIALKHRLKPQAPAQPEARPETVSPRPRATVPPVIQQVLAPTTAPVLVLEELIPVSTTPKERAHDKKPRRTASGSFSQASSTILGPPAPATGRSPGRGRAPDHAGR